MNIFELLVAVLILTGTVAGGTTGASHGIVGIVVGLLIGALLGLATGYAVIFCFALLCKLIFGGSLFGPRAARSRKTKPPTAP